MDLSKWTRQEVLEALAENGYVDEFLQVEFQGVNERGHAIFKIAYEDIDNSIGYGRVYVYINQDGKLVGSY